MEECLKWLFQPLTSVHQKHPCLVQDWLSLLTLLMGRDPPTKMNRGPHVVPTSSDKHAKGSYPRIGESCVIPIIPHNASQISQELLRCRIQVVRLDRLSKDPQAPRMMPTGLIASRYRRQIVDKTLERELAPGDVLYVLKAIETLTLDEIDRAYLFPLLCHWFDAYYDNQPPTFADKFRRTVCYLDGILYN